MQGQAVVEEFLRSGSCPLNRSVGLLVATKIFVFIRSHTSFVPFFSKWTKLKNREKIFSLLTFFNFCFRPNSRRSDGRIPKLGGTIPLTQLHYYTHILLQISESFWWTEEATLIFPWTEESTLIFSWTEKATLMFPWTEKATLMFPWTEKATLFCYGQMK